MSGSLSIINRRQSVISVSVNDERLFCDILPDVATGFKSVPAGSVSVCVTDSREKIIFDLWLSVNKNDRLVLKISDSACVIA